MSTDEYIYTRVYKNGEHINEMLRHRARARASSHARASGVAEILLSLRSVQAPLIDRSLATLARIFNRSRSYDTMCATSTSGCTEEDRGINREYVAISQR
jgi:hypothetical protein